MKLIRLFVLLASILFSLSAFSTELGAVTFSATMTKIIGTFSTYGHPAVGDTFELDMSNLPKEKIDMVRPHLDKTRDVAPYVPLQSPLKIEWSELDMKSTGYLRIRLCAIQSKSGGQVVIQLTARSLEKGEKVKLYIYEENPRWMRCMAEAEGVIK